MPHAKITGVNGVHLKDSGPEIDPLTGMNYSDLYRNYGSDSRMNYERLKDRNKRLQSLMDLDPRTTEAMLLNIAGAWEAGQIRKQFNEVRENAHSKYLALSDKKAKAAEQKRLDSFYGTTYSKQAQQQVLEENPEHDRLSSIPGVKGKLRKAEKFVASETRRLKLADKAAERKLKKDDEQAKKQQKDFEDKATRFRKEASEEETARAESLEKTTKRNRDILDRLLKKHDIESYFAGVDLDAFADKYRDHKGKDGYGQGLKDVIERIAHSPAILINKKVDLGKVGRILKSVGLKKDDGSFTTLTEVGTQIQKLQTQLLPEDVVNRETIQQELNALVAARDEGLRQLTEELNRVHKPRVRSDRFTSADPLAELDREFSESFQRGPDFSDELRGLESSRAKETLYGRSPSDVRSRKSLLSEMEAELNNLGRLTDEKRQQLSAIQREGSPKKKSKILTNPATGESSDGSITINPKELKIDENIVGGDVGAVSVGKATEVGGLYKNLNINNEAVNSAVLESLTHPDYPDNVTSYELTAILKNESGSNNYSPNTIGQAGEIGSWQIKLSTAMDTSFAEGKNEAQVKRELKHPSTAVIYAAQILSDIKKTLNTNSDYKRMSPHDKMGLAFFAYNGGITRTLEVLKLVEPNNIREFLDYDGTISIKGKNLRGIPSISKRYVQRGFTHILRLKALNSEDHKKKSKILAIPPTDKYESSITAQPVQDIQPVSPQEIDVDIPPPIPKVDNKIPLSPSNISPREIQPFPVPSGDLERERITFAQEQKKFMDAYNIRMESANRAIEHMRKQGIPESRLEMSKLNLINMKFAAQQLDRHDGVKFAEAWTKFVEDIRGMIRELEGQ